MVGYCEDGNEPHYHIKGGKFLAELKINKSRRTLFHGLRHDIF